MSAHESKRRTFSEGGPAIVVALDDDLYDRYADHFPAESGGMPIELHRASDLADPDREADLHLGGYRPTTPSCGQILAFAQQGPAERGRFSQLEQDHASGTVYRDGQMVWASAPVAVWCATDGTDELRAGSDGAVLFLDGPRARITTIPSVFWVERQFTLRALGRDEYIPSDWTDVAAKALKPDGAEGSSAR